METPCTSYTTSTWGPSGDRGPRDPNAEELALAIGAAMRLDPAVHAEVHGLVNEWLLVANRGDGADREAER